MNAKQNTANICKCAGAVSTSEQIFRQSNLITLYYSNFVNRKILGGMVQRPNFNLSDEKGGLKSPLMVLVRSLAHLIHIRCAYAIKS